jgi:hypothetical protein
MKTRIFGFKGFCADWLSCETLKMAGCSVKLCCVGLVKAKEMLNMQTLMIDLFLIIFCVV